jgi:hypothetical protein
MSDHPAENGIDLFVIMAARIPKNPEYEGR